MFSFVLFFSIQSLFLQHKTKRTRNGEFSTFIKKRDAGQAESPWLSPLD
jgi:hypothetical protein